MGGIVSGGALSLRPLLLADAAIMAIVLADHSLYRYTGGEPPTEAELVRRYSTQIRGVSPDGREVWVNLVVTLDAQPIGYVQATIPDGGDVAEIAWVIGRRWQSRGYAKEAVRLLVGDLVGRGIRRAVAHIHPDHLASQRVAGSIGLSVIDEVIDGEVRWAGTIG